MRTTDRLGRQKSGLMQGAPVTVINLLFIGIRCRSRYPENIKGVRELKIIVIYDSAFGNTEKVARAIAGGLAAAGEVKVVRASEMGTGDLSGVNMIVIGSPTQGFRPLATVQDLLDNLPETLKGTKAAAFDTRIGGKDAKAAGRFVARLGGYAAARIAGSMKKKGLHLIAEPEGFLVNDSKGPLAQGELERAEEWGRKIAESAGVTVR